MRINSTLKQRSAAFFAGFLALISPVTLNSQIIKLGDFLNKKPRKIKKSKIKQRLRAKKRKVINVLTTGYGASSQSDNGGWAKLTSTGIPLKQGVAAVSRDPKKRILPIGTKINIEGYGPAVIGDVGSGVRANQIDLCFNSTNTAAHWKKIAKVTVLGYQKLKSAKG
ncbi:MAG: hypothetical protein C4562_06685 [Actinobacteria bacterium]|nr:MAG: hypothetical protein C4562_06685 [Actinomycetota bacterium]